MSQHLRAVLIIALISVGTSCGNKESSTKTAGGAFEGTISLSGAFALYPLANKWAEEFRKLHPDVRFNISAGGAGKGMADALAGAVDLGMLSREVKPAEAGGGAWSIAVTKDAVVPVVNSGNPVINDLKRTGLSQAHFKKIFVDNAMPTWGDAVNTSATQKINIYTRSDASGAAATWAEYLGGAEQEVLKGVGVFGDPGLADAVKKDASGIGYNNVIYVYDLNTKQKYPGIDVVPIDVNSDGKLSQEELFYDDLDQLMAAIGDGRFPSPPARELYFVSKGKPQSPVVIEFLRWVLAEGQNFVAETGYIRLPDARIQTELAKLK
ncbi:MAG TPA: substrate-binding domain-containing protein [Chryseolinea sp.]